MTYRLTILHDDEPGAQLVEMLNTCRDLDRRVAAARRKAERDGHWGDTNRLSGNRDILAAKVVDTILDGNVITGDASVLEARAHSKPEVWAVVELDYDDYPVGAPLSYHWTEASARDWMRHHGPRHPARAVRARQVRIDGDLPETEEAT